MENLSHSRLPNKGLPSLPKKACNGNTFNSGKANTYDDVFGGPPRFGASALSPRLEDYGEIFGGFNAPRGLSIPVLDLPLVHEDEVFSDVRSSGFDYGEVFGGFDSLDFASSYEELVMDQSKGGDGDSSEEAWTPVETESPLEGSDHSGKSPCLSNGDSLESIDGSMEFSVSYNKACQSEIGMSNGVTHVTESIPGYTFAVDKTTRLPKEYENPCLKVTDDSTLDNTGRMMKGRHLRKTKTLHSANGNTGGQTFEDDVTKRKMYSRNSSFPNSMFVTVSEVSLRTQPSELPPPSRPPPLLDARTEDACRFTSNSGTNATEGPAFASSPPFFDVEIDASSAAAVSAAAIKEAMEKAQAKIKSAKESMERKRESVKNNLKSGSKNGRKDKEGTLNKNVDGSDGIKEEIACGVRAQGDNGMNFYVRDERHKVIKSTQEVPGSIEVDKIFNVVRKSSEEKPEKKSLSPQQLNEIDENDEWKEATQFFELVRLDKSRASFEYENSEDILLHNTKFLHEDGQKEKWSTVRNSEKQPERKLKAVGENQTAEKLEKKSETAKVVCEHKDKYGKSGTSIEAPRQKKHEKKVKIVKDFHEEEGEKKSKIAPQPVGAEKKATSIDQSEKYGNLEKVRQENKISAEQAMKKKENNSQLKEASRSVQNQKCTNGSHGREVCEKTQEEVFELKENDRKLRKALEEEEFEKRIKEVLEQEEKEKRLKEVLEQEESEKKKKEAHEREDNERRLNEARELVKDERRQNVALKYAEEERRMEEAFDHAEERKLKDAPEQDEMEKRQLQALEREEKEKRFKEALQREENERAVKEAREREETEKRLEMAHEEEIEKCLKEAYGKVSLEEECGQEDSSRILKESPGGEESEMRLKEAFKEEINEKTKKACNLEETEKQLKDTAQSEELKTTNQEQQPTENDKNRKMCKEEEGTNLQREVEYLGVSDEAYDPSDDEDLQTTESARKQEMDSGKLEKIQVAFVEEDRKMVAALKDTEKRPQVVGTVDILFDEEYVKSGMVRRNLEFVESLSRDAYVAELLIQEQRVNRAGEAGSSIAQTDVEKTKDVSQLGSDLRNHNKKFAYELEGRGNHITQTQTILNQEENRDKSSSNETMRESVEGGKKVELTESSMLEGKRSTPKAAQQVNDRNARRKDRNLNEFSRLEEKESERIRRERELENERLRKIEEEREREREREKDRMAVDRLNAEVRDRAERLAVERVTAEARQRALAEARERLEKACAEAKEKSFGEKASVEARLRAERAAVERATAEARERAAEKAAFEARERMERSVSDKFSTSSRNSGMRPSSSFSDVHDHQFQTTGSLGAQRFHSAYGASYYGEKSEGVDGESAQRCKARLERHRRTAERAAKALAEKNMRDLIAQREQAERNRLAETLDADVKRWSSGKEGNLRALLSTLQYILGPDSGWQPIPLTEVITAPAVKKAYRKATLCVHPDKLQQRGASIQQKYICEKVFDLLKEAWNKFNSEER